MMTLKVEDVGPTKKSGTPGGENANPSDILDAINDSGITI